MNERENNKEIPQKRSLVIGLVGCLASGKTTLSAELGKRWGITPVEENYPANPFLEKFYENPPEYSFRSQVNFLISKVEQLKALDKNKVSIIDPELDMDFIYAKTHFKMGWMNENEWNLYQNIFYTITAKDNLVYPDVHVVVTTSQKEIKQRIIDRGRGYEMWILNNYPEYLEKLSDSVNEWANREEKNSFKFIAYTTKENAYGGVEHLANRIESHICSRFGINGNFIIPEIKPPKLNGSSDYFPEKVVIH